MVCLPVFTKVQVSDYGLFPGLKRDGRVDWEFEPGLSLIVGINGLGKTTLLTMLLRALTGPFDLTGLGAPEKLESILPSEPRALNRQTMNFFAQRVADRAEDAQVSLAAKFGQRTIVIRRRLSNLYLEALEVDGKEMALSGTRGGREADFQSLLCQLFELSSFVDVLLILHHIVFFTERRAGALWDENAQRQILRALFLKKELAAEVAQLERDVNKADGRFRRTRAEATTHSGPP